MALVLNIEKQHPLRPRERYRFEGRGLRIIKIGRLRSAHIPLDEAMASRVQAYIRVENARAEIENVGQGQLLLNGQALPTSQRQEIFSEDELSIGCTTLKLKLRPAGAEPTLSDIRPKLLDAIRNVGDATSFEILELVRQRRNPPPVLEARPVSGSFAALPSGPLPAPPNFAQHPAEEKYNTDYLLNVPSTRSPKTAGRYAARSDLGGPLAQRGLGHNARGPPFLSLGSSRRELTLATQLAIDHKRSKGQQRRHKDHGCALQGPVTLDHRSPQQPTQPHEQSTMHRTHNSDRDGAGPKNT